MRRLLLSCIAVLSLIAPACGELLDPAAAVVNGKKITVEQISAELDRFERSPEFDRLAEQGDAQELKRQVEQQILSQEIRRAVLEPKADEVGIEVTDEDVQERLEQVKADFPNEGAFAETLKEQGLTLDQLEGFLRDNILEEQLRTEITKDAGPTDEELQAHYDENIADFQETEAQHILVDDKALAARLARQLKAAPRNQIDDLFARLAERYSTDEGSAATGGELGYFKPGDFVPPFEKAADALEIGEISDPVRSEFGFHVIRVTDRRVAEFGDVVEDIRSEIGAGAEDEAWDSFVEEAYSEADVKVNPRYGEFDEETLQVVDPTAEDVPGAEEGGAPAPTPSGGPAPTEP
ncbi:MAG TPA: peptidylprolyl isomerase [Actinomycetota bacterium]|nr:peptidylprolyl isomerase [Actinomycetota bacterium]